jgi:phosphatidate cytidylyltransferase
VVSATVTVRPARLSASLPKRVATAVVVVPVLVWVITRAPGWVFTLVVVAAGAVALWELARMFEGAGRPAQTWLGMGLGMFVTASFALPGGAVVPPAVLTVAVALVLSAPLLSRGPLGTEPVALTVVGLVYVSWFLGHTLALHGRPEGGRLVLFLVAVTWAGESAAYLVGSALGRHKLLPQISPNKTLEGAVAQVTVAVVAAAVVAGWLLPDWSMARTVPAGVILGVVGQAGDLAESAMKRAAGVKDTGGLLPGHGGVLDRLDSLLFNGPALYYYLVLGGAA